MARSKKNPADVLSEQERTDLENATNEGLKEAVQKAAMAEVENLAARDADQHLAECKAAAKEAAAQYKEASARHKAIIVYSKSLLEARGAR